MDEGYIKFQADWTRTSPLSDPRLADLQIWRDRLYDLGLIGAYPDGIGFGNISCRYDDEGRFLISGSATGNLPRLTAGHYALVTEVDIDANRLRCEGPVIASSESMSHAVIYRECPWVNGVIHVHNLALWERLLYRAPTTDDSATYGSPEMAYSIIDLLQTTNLPEVKLFVMAGHREGIFSFGRNLDEAGEVLLDWMSEG